MADGGASRAYGPNDLWALNLEAQRRAAEADASRMAAAADAASADRAGLNEGRRPRLNLSMAAEPAGLNEATPRAPGPPMAAPLPDPSPVAPGGKVKAKDVRKQFDNLTFWDRMVKTPEWQRGVEGVGEVRTATADRAAKPDAMQRAAEAAEADAAELDKEAARLTKEGKISEARDKSTAAFTKRQQAAETALRTAKVNEVTEAQKKAKDWIANAKKKKADVWSERKKGAKRIGGGTIAGVGLAYIGGKLIEDWQEDQATLPENVEAEGIINRFFGSGEMTDADAAKLSDRVGPEMFEQILTTRPEEAQTRPPGPPLRETDSIPLIDVDYRPGAEKPSIAETPSAYDGAVAKEIAKTRPDLAADYAMQSQGENHRRDAMALTDAGIENTAAAAGSPDWLMNYLRDQGGYARAADAGAAPTSDNWWNNYIAGPLGEAQAQQDEFYSDPANRTGLVYNAYDALPEWAQDGLSAVNALNPFEMAAGALQTTTNEAAAAPYSMVRDGLLGAGQVTGLNEEAFGPVYREALRAMGGEPLLDDPLSQRANLPADSMDFPPTAMPTDMAVGTGSGTGTYGTGMPDLQDLQKLADIGALGRNPDGSNMTVPQYMRENPPTGMGMQPALPMSADIPVRGVVDGGLPSTMPRPGGPLRPSGEIPPLQPLAGLPDIEELRPALPRLAGPPDLSQFMPPPPIADPGGPSVSGAGPGVDDMGPYRMGDLEAMAETGGLGVRPDGSFVTVPEFLGKGGAAGRGVDMDASAPAVQPGGPGDQFASLGGLFGPAMAGTLPDDPPSPAEQAADEAARAKAEADAYIAEVTGDIAGRDETTNPRGQFEPEAAKPVDAPPAPVEETGGWWESWFGTDNGKTADQYRAEDAAPAGLPTTAPGAAPTTAPTAAAVPEPNGPRGDFGGSKGSVSAGLADDATDAEAELNWINRQMRDKMGMDASTRAKAAEALISFGSTVLASKGDSWQAIGAGLQAGLGSVLESNDEEAASAAAYQDQMTEDSRWQQEMALKRLNASQGGGDKMSTVQAYMQQLMDAGWEYQAAKDEAERYAGVKSPTAWSQSDIFDMIKGSQQEPA